ncbi:SGNH/GDSL hydrolase family protein [Siphonobacter aquaeclarae]|uniref:Uncharacterized protein n=1 Tax=Siphonobacter aquaeclarae TaxID=563176 RepID=A0A1G9T333_9BACT|nr:SGNH/GDSL hydrolase family protein [Siphonobacter aquaeclarae]SDM41485.1 hypothetical protein SAMN04488090_3375 [Siphonobacter aquaeclarae]
MWTLTQVKAKIQEKVRAATRQMKVTANDLADLLDANAEFVDERYSEMRASFDAFTTTYTQVPQIVPVPDYAYSTYTTLNTFKEQLSWYFVKASKRLEKVGVFIFKRSSQGTITADARLQVLHRRGTTTTVLLDTVIPAADMARYNQADAIVNYRDYEYVAKLAVPIDVVGGDELFVSLSCDTYLNPVHSSTNKLSTTGEWNDGTNVYRLWNYNLPSTRTTIPTKTVDQTYHAIHFYNEKAQIIRLETLESGLTSANAGITSLTQTVTPLSAQVDANTKAVSPLATQLLPVAVIQPVPSYALLTYSVADSFKEQLSWYFVKAAKQLDRVGVFIFKRSSQGTITADARIQVLHRRGTTVTVLLDRTILAASLAAYNNADVVSDYRNYEVVSDLNTPIAVLPGDELAVSLSCDTYLNPIYSATDALLSSGEWNDGTGCFRLWGYGLPGKRTAFPDKTGHQEANYHAINWYEKRYQSTEINGLKTRVTALEALNPSGQEYTALVPRNIYFPNNSFAARHEAVILYAQRFVRDKLPVWINNVGQHRLNLSRDDSNTANVNAETVSLTLKCPGYVDKAVSINRLSVRPSVLAAQFPKVLYLGDSVTENRPKNGIQQGAGAMWAMLKEISLMNRADNGGTGYDLLCVGTKFKVDSTISYKGQNLNVYGYAQGIGSWTAFNYLRHPFNLHTNKAGAWALLGLLTSQGRAYTASPADNLLIAKTCYGVTAPVINNESYTLLVSAGQIADAGLWTGSAAQVSAVQAWIDLVAANNLQTTNSNPFFDITKTGSNRFSVAAYLSRYKTLADDGVTRLSVGSSAGSRVTSNTAWDVCTPTHVVICLGENDRSHTSNYAAIADDIAELGNEFKAAIPAAKLAFCLTPIPGVMHPERYPDYTGRFSQFDHNNKFDFYSVVAARFGTLAEQTAAGFYLVETWHTMTPAGHMLIQEQTDNGTGGVAKVGYPDSIHPGWFPLREGGVQLYGWLGYTYTV